MGASCGCESDYIVHDARCCRNLLTVRLSRRYCILLASMASTSMQIVMHFHVVCCVGCCGPYRTYMGMMFVYRQSLQIEPRYDNICTEFAPLSRLAGRNVWHVQDSGLPATYITRAIERTRKLCQTPTSGLPATS